MANGRQRTMRNGLKSTKVLLSGFSRSGVDLRAILVNSAIFTPLNEPRLM